MIRPSRNFDVRSLNGNFVRRTLWRCLFANTLLAEIAFDCVDFVAPQLRLHMAGNGERESFIHVQFFVDYFANKLGGDGASAFHFRVQRKISP